METGDGIVPTGGFHKSGPPWRFSDIVLSSGVKVRISGQTLKGAVRRAFGQSAKISDLTPKGFTVTDRLKQTYRVTFA